MLFTFPPHQNVGSRLAEWEEYGLWPQKKKKNLGEILILSPPAVPLGQFTQLQSWLPHRLMRDDRVGG